MSMFLPSPFRRQTRFTFSPRRQFPRPHLRIIQNLKNIPGVNTKKNPNQLTYLLGDVGRSSIPMRALDTPPPRFILKFNRGFLRLRRRVGRPLVP